MKIDKDKVIKNENRIKELSYYNWNIYKLEESIQGYDYILHKCDEDYGWDDFILGVIEDGKFEEKLYFTPMRFNQKYLDLNGLSEDYYS